MKRAQEQEPPRLVVFLGNPGSQYRSTRHNIAWMVLDRLVGRLTQGPVALDPPDRWKEKFHSRMARCTVHHHDMVLLRPETFMNNSGQAVRRAADFFSIPPAATLVLHDDLETPFGGIHVVRAGGHRGHNGVRSITRHLGTDSFSRMRLGIGRPPGGRDTASWVLERFAHHEEAVLQDFLNGAVEALEEIFAGNSDMFQMTKPLVVV